MKLYIEMLPSACWGRNLRTVLKKSDWDKIRKKVYEKAEMKCQICGRECKTLDAHEVWEFNVYTRTQRLKEIIGICKSCHNVIHYGRASQIGYADNAKRQFIRVNKCSVQEFVEELNKATTEFLILDTITDWELDISLVEKQGYKRKE